MRRPETGATSPDVASSSPAMILSTVDLPAPLTPTRATCSLSTNWKLRSRNICSAPKDLVKWETVRSVRGIDVGFPKGETWLRAGVAQQPASIEGFRDRPEAQTGGAPHARRLPLCSLAATKRRALWLALRLFDVDDIFARHGPGSHLHAPT